MNSINNKIKQIVFIIIFVSMKTICLSAEDDFGSDPFADKPAEVKADKLKKKNVSEMNLKELQEHQKFVYVPGLRDPFTFRIAKKKKVEHKEIEEVEIHETKSTGMPSDKQQEEKMNEWYALTRNFMIAGAYKDAISSGDNVKSKVDKWGGLSSIKAQQMYERILGLRQTAVRLANKEEITNRFLALPITVKGIRVSDTGAAALVNENIVEIGMKITLDDGEELQVDSIEDRGVIFIYSGLKLRKNITVENKK
ncbi:MAG: hypothetical protein ACYTFY_00520 [Planctomycetota bacterium]|jgi:hypothetical protein